MQFSDYDQTKSATFNLARRMCEMGYPIEYALLTLTGRDALEAPSYTRTLRVKVVAKGPRLK